MVWIGSRQKQPVDLGTLAMLSFVARIIPSMLPMGPLPEEFLTSIPHLS